MQLNFIIKNKPNRSEETEVYHHLGPNRPYSRWLFPTYPETLRCQIQAGQSKLVSLTHFLPRDIFPCAV